MLLGLSLIHTADATQLSSWEASAVWTHPSAVVTQFTIFCAVELLRLVTSDDIMTSSLKKKLSMSLKIYQGKPLQLTHQTTEPVKPSMTVTQQKVTQHWHYCLVSFEIVDRIRRQSSWASCELCSHRRRRRDSTRQFESRRRRRRRCVLGIVQELCASAIVLLSRSVVGCRVKVNPCEISIVSSRRSSRGRSGWRPSEPLTPTMVRDLT